MKAKNILPGLIFIKKNLDTQMMTTPFQSLSIEK